MKKYFLKSTVVAFASIMMLLQGCVKDKLITTYTYYEPVYEFKSIVLASVKSEAPRTFQQTGKLIKYNNYIFLNEINKGVHVIDNTNPSNPKNIRFISVPGNLDIAVRNNCLYADVFTDLLSIDISNLDNVVLKKVVPGIFPDRNQNAMSSYDSNKYVIDWIARTTSSKEDFEKHSGLLSNAAVNFSSAVASTNSVGGSMSRFTIINNYLYTVGRNLLSSFDVSIATNPIVTSSQPLPSNNIETIYPFNDRLFIGGQTGMNIYSIVNPTRPAYQNNFSHACFNDPVVADGNYAFVTLRATAQTSPCWGTPAAQRNELDVVDVTDLRQSVLRKIYTMTEPKGLSKDGNLLFICDGHDGLKIYDAGNVNNMQLIKQFSGINTFDVIAQSGLAVVATDHALYQFDYSNVGNIKQVSVVGN